MGYSPWGPHESVETEQLHFHFSLSRNGEGNGNPLQCSCLENPRDCRAWWAAVYGVAQSRTRLKRLRSSSSRLCRVREAKGCPGVEGGGPGNPSGGCLTGGDPVRCRPSHRGWETRACGRFWLDKQQSLQAASDFLRQTFWGGGGLGSS